MAVAHIMKEKLIYRKKRNIHIGIWGNTHNPQYMSRNSNKEVSMWHGKFVAITLSLDLRYDLCCERNPCSSEGRLKHNRCIKFIIKLNKQYYAVRPVVPYSISTACKISYY